ncbi:hypothetical protein KC366_g1564 [Hortaea werneckii]|uniref:Uncharacterized protein n=5 Tax=Hortaea werneckii TaxID=91943 RepID=A0A3M7J8C3_HORWE|nr:hypothetical protein KC361_g7440 [Hortaea werneckii]OTA33797.1 hypothetical protein BTJ68_08092 [Hortaea werneckii EXF-2000]KAI6815263.1 hypothetical protein KC358_g10974 [Hortaea werneckii]KAI7049418.1 hypothetical protein KC366_g1564 [Hortaea werneckii]KAI7148886.1 hypothetical protein KC344_g1496 [Hortaea werneckii]
MVLAHMTMPYNTQRRETLCRLGIEQLPAIMDEPEWDNHQPVQGFPHGLPVRTMPVPGRRCPACLSRGQTVWVIPGKRCPQCGTEVN